MCLIGLFLCNFTKTYNPNIRKKKKIDRREKGNDLYYLYIVKTFVLFSTSLFIESD